MDYINITLAFSFILAYAIMSYFQLKKLKEKILHVIEGKLENKKLSKLINRARTSSKNQFSFFMFFHGLLASTSVTIVLIMMDLLNKSYKLGIVQYLFLFLFLSVAFTLTGIVKSNSIWRQVHNMGNE